MNANALAALLDVLWPQGDSLSGQQVFAIVDSARDTRIPSMLRATGLEQICLFAGPLTPALQDAAPRLVHLSQSAKLTQPLFELGWEDNWFVIVKTNADVTLQQLHRHLRTLLRVRTEQGSALLFRFYDPRVLRAYLPTCTAVEALSVFGPISEFGCFGSDAASMIGFTRSSAGVMARHCGISLRLHRNA